MVVAIYRRGGSVLDIQEEDGDIDLMTEHTTDTPNQFKMKLNGHKNAQIKGHKSA